MLSMMMMVMDDDLLLLLLDSQSTTTTTTLNSFAIRLMIALANNNNNNNNNKSIFFFTCYCCCCCKFPFCVLYVFVSSPQRCVYAQLWPPYIHKIFTYLLTYSLRYICCFRQQQEQQQKAKSVFCTSLALLMLYDSDNEMMSSRAYSSIVALSLN